jgi:hypothetical protein
MVRLGKAVGMAGGYRSRPERANDAIWGCG